MNSKINSLQTVREDACVVVTNGIGNTVIYRDVIADIVGHAALDCFGVVGMVSRGVVADLSGILRKGAMDKGVDVRIDKGQIDIDMHIIIGYGVNIKAATQSIIEKVRYDVEYACGLPVRKVNVFVDRIQD